MNRGPNRLIPLALPFVLALTSATRLVSQATPSIEPGTRVRVTAPAMTPHARRVGSVLTVRADTLLLRRAFSGDTLAIALPLVTRLEVSRSRRRHAYAGAGIGGAVGFLYGWKHGSSHACAHSGPSQADSSCFGVFDVFLGTLGGALIGSAVGALVRTDRWEPVPREGWLSLAPRTAGGARPVAQPPSSLEPGTRVRVIVDAGRRYGEDRYTVRVGSVLGMQGDTMLLAGDRGDTLLVPFSAVTRLQVSRGLRRTAREGAGIGAGIGILAGAWIGANYPKCSDPGEALCRAWTGLLGAGAGGVTVGAVGALAGLVFRTERWERVPLRDRARVSLVPRSDGGLQLSIAVSL